MGSTNIKGITIEIGGETTKLDKALQGINSTTKTLQNQLKAVNQALKLDPKNTELLAQKQEILSKSIETTKEKLQTLKTAQEQTAAAFARGEIDENQYRALQTEITKTETELKNLELQLKKGKNAFEEVGAAVQDVGEKFTKAGEKIAKVGDGMQSAGKALMPVTAAIAGVGTASVASAMNFEDAIAKLSTIADTSKETGVPLHELEEQIKELSDQTGISASEIADNVYNAISAGQDTGDAVNFVAQSTKLATAGFAESGQALDLLTTILNAYGMEADEVNHVSDVLINTQNKGKTTVGELASAMGKIIPTANASNVSLEQLAAGYSIMTANGIATAETTTYMNSMLNELSKSGTTASNTIKNRTGKSFQELMNDGASLADVLQILQEQAEEDGIAMSDMFGSAESGKAAMTLLSGGVEEFNGLVSDMKEGVNGATDDAFGKLNTTSHQAKISLNEIKNAGIELGSTILTMLMPYFQQFTQKIKEVTSWFKNLDESQKQMIVRIAAVVAAVAPALLIGGKVISGVGKLTSGIGGIITKAGGLISKMGGLSGAFSAIASPVGIVIAAIAALAAGFVYLYNTNDEFREKINAAIEKVKQAFQSMVEKVKPLLEKLKESFQKLMTALQPVFEFIITAVMAVVNGIMNAIAPIISAITNVVDFITNIISAFTALFTGDLDGFVSYITAAFQNVIDFITNIVTAIVDFVIGFFEGFGVDIKQVFTDIWDGIVSIFQGVGQWFTDRFTEAYNAVVAIFNGIGEWFSARWDDIKNVFAAIGTWFQTKFQEAYTNVTNIFSAIGEWFSNRLDDIKKVFSSIGTWFKTKFQEAYTNIKNVFSNIGSFFSGIWEKIKGTFTSIGTKIGDAIGGAFKDAINSVISTVENAINGAIGLINGAIGLINKIPGVDIGKIGEVSFPRLAKGGILREGQAIVAEAGPEIVRIVNGKAVVMPLTNGARNMAIGNGNSVPMDILYRRTEGYIDDAIARATAAGQGGNMGKCGDYIQNINIESPKALSAYEVARQTRNQTRNMVLQLQGGR